MRREASDMINRSVSRWMLAVVVAALAGCGGPGGSSVMVTRPGRETQELRSVQLACTISHPNAEMPETTVLECVHGDPETDGIEIGARLDRAIEEMPAGTTLEHGTDFHVYAIAGGADGRTWGASGSDSWWTGDLMIVLEGTAAEGQTATFQGTMQTTAAVDVTPISLSFDTVTATLD
jgi:hypothetical protein